MFLRNLVKYVPMDEAMAAAIEAISDRMSELRWSKAELARQAGVDANTIGDFMSGKRWPRRDTRRALERALGFGDGYIELIVRNVATALDEPPALDTGRVRPEAETVLLKLPSSALEGLTDIEREELEMTVRATALQRLREIRGN